MNFDETSYDGKALSYMCINNELKSAIYCIRLLLKKLINLSPSLQLIPGLSSWKYYEAKKHAAAVGVGQPVPSILLHREKIKAESLEHFIDFITSSHVIKDIPFGQKTLKMGSGEIVPIPNVVRSLSASSLINQYIQLCEEEDITPLGIYRFHNDQYCISLHIY